MARKPLSFYRAAWQAIKGDVVFKVDLRKKLSSAQKGLITRYHTEIQKQTGFRSTQRYVSNSKRKLEAVKGYTGQAPGFPGLKVAYIPIPNGAKAKVTVTKSGKVKVVTNEADQGEITRIGYLFDNYMGEDSDLMMDTAKVVKAILEDDNGKSVRFNMMCGQHESKGAFSAKFVEQEVQRYLSEYDETEKWFHGVIGYSFDGQADFETYLAKRKEKPKRKRKRRK